MRSMWTRLRLKAFVDDERGVAAIEYGLIATGIVVGAIEAFDRFGQAVDDNLYDIIYAINSHL